MLTLLTLLPIVGALIVLALGKNLARATAFVFSFASLALTLVLWFRFDPTSSALQFQEIHPWIALSALNVDYHLGVDGLGLLMLLLAAIVVPIGMAASSEIQQRVPLYYALILLFQACLVGTFTAQNFFHFFQTGFICQTHKQHFVSGRFIHVLSLFEDIHFFSPVDIRFIENNYGWYMIGLAGYQEPVRESLGGFGILQCGQK